jgi:hypothetical protein
MRYVVYCCLCCEVVVVGAESRRNGKHVEELGRDCGEEFWWKQLHMAYMGYQCS